MQQTKTQVFIFVEGRDLDPQVYGAICGPVCTDSGLNYEIVVADRINGSGGGKHILTGFLQYLESLNSLVDRSGPNAKLAMFYLDKDVDDILKTLISSDHLTYTIHHSIENHLFAEGDLVASLATGGSLDIQVIQPRVPNPTAWRRTAATRWREWVALCILARKLALSYPVTFERPSALNDPADATTDAAKLATHLTQMEARSGLPHDEFQRKVTAAYKLVDRFYARGAHDLLFKGKWYVKFAVREIETAYPLFNSNGAADRLIGSLIATTNFEGPWVQHFRRPLRAALSAL